MLPKLDLQDYSGLWDVVIIGAGLGGGVTARALADSGYDVLLIERGHEELSSLRVHSDTDHSDHLLAQGKWPTVSAFEVDGVLKRWLGPFGSGIGGSTNLYAAALERFERHDMDTLPDLPHPTDGWPISYQGFLPYYEQAERMMHVAGTADPLNADDVRHLREPPPLGPPETDFFDFFEKRGMHPYRLHVGIRYRPGCDECIGRQCQKDCKADVRSVLAGGRKQPTILARTEVLRLESSPDCVTAAVLLRGEAQITVQAKVFILAAGAIHTPKLLLDSRSEHWPDGLANRSGLVGRNLMFHAMQRLAIWPSRRLAGSGPRKSIGFRDLYRVNGERFGSVQSTGFEVEYGDLLVHFYRVFDHSAFRRLRIIRPLLRIPAALAVLLFGCGTLFSCLIEDLPYPDNRVLIDENEADRVRIVYTIKDELRDRVTRFRNLLTERLGKSRMFFLSHDVELNFGHPCGTCVMGDDPATSVVDRDCRAHGLANLFIADASFMPTSGATNPALTIAANALRVSDAIHRALEEGAVRTQILDELPT
jgi:choline dehydrogenase-like flavoprotein